MLKRSFVPAAAATVVLATVAHASLITSPGTAPSPQAQPQQGSLSAETGVRRPDAAIKAPAAQAEAAAPSHAGKPAPRVIDLPRADATSPSYVVLPSPVEATAQGPAARQAPRMAELPRPETDQAPAAGRAPAQAPAAAAPSQPRFSEEPAPERTAPVRRARAPEPVDGVRPADTRNPKDVRTAKWAGGEGAVWTTGRDARAFTATFGGCRISGGVGPRGYTIDRAC
ncbi:translation initiation factor IF-2 [Methylobacterium nonmethylotrophicum]|uniref:Translation initiation factor IF-2 n=1 Tax=Methylobacterium nonmethylotrophicum TaxID=1141884 RepID=A0A4Z0NJT1_9HYPH|nr:translation initiation factor IF-2 [Methylobacterium nonmethylotrophicum]TGD95746.1 translation initiation factor IF-2 [Methylobacterium nonmethylotrophicum]